MGFVAGVVAVYVLIGLALLVRDRCTADRKVRKLGEYPRWPLVLWERWPRPRKSPSRPLSSD